MTTQVLGLDIGGANLKAAHSHGVARSVPFALWKHPDRLADELARLGASMPAHDRLAVTMTGELCDCFETRRAGVQAILQSVAAAAGRTPIRVWSTHGRFLEVDAVRADPLCAAAANWLALAHFVARRFPHERMLLIDTGSTTTDLVYLNHGVPQPRYLTDTERLQAGELVYTGLRRTPICAVVGMAEMEVAAEFFATMLDAYVFLKVLPENPDDRDTADGRPLTRGCAHARLARMRCADVETFSETHAHVLATHAVQTQQRAVGIAHWKVLNEKPEVQRVVVSGSGEVVGRMVAERWGRPVTSLGELLGPALSEAACAYAVASLAAEETQDER
jgi:probable H4MPT-linked C1 transfer pathway protein